MEIIYKKNFCFLKKGFDILYSTIFPCNVFLFIKPFFIKTLSFIVFQKKYPCSISSSIFFNKCIRIDD